MTKAGRVIDVSVTISPILDPSGCVVGASKVARDISERIRQETAQRRVAVLSASNRKLEREISRRGKVERELRKSEAHLKQVHVQLKRLAHMALHTQEEERLRISHDLHDQVIQTLLGINVRLATLRKANGASGPDFMRQLSHTQRLVEQSVETVHDFARDLRPALLNDLGFIPAMNAYLKKILRETGIRASLVVFSGIEKLNTAMLTTLYRVAQESLTNVIRHAKAHAVQIQIRQTAGRVCMSIRDNGGGFDVPATTSGNKGRRLGLAGMRERMEMAGGDFEIRSTKGKGTTITVRAPIMG
jgi:signal transduction histidine kinase